MIHITAQSAPGIYAVLNMISVHDGNGEYDHYAVDRIWAGELDGWNDILQRMTPEQQRDRKSVV